MKWLDRLWRSLGTQLCFTVFALGGVAMGMTVLPLFYIFLRGHRRYDAGKSLIGLSFKAFVAMMKLCGVIKVKVTGGERLKQGGLLLVANHPSLIDFVVLGSLVPRADCLVKSALKRHSTRRWPVLLAGYIVNDEGQATLDRVKDSLGRGNSVIIFPEGTRTEPGQSPKFLRGAAQLAVRTQHDATPVAILAKDNGLHKGGKWWLAPDEPVLMEVKVLEPVMVEPVLKERGGEFAMAARDFNALLEGKIKKELE